MSMICQLLNTQVMHDSAVTVATATGTTWSYMNCQLDALSIPEIMVPPIQLVSNVQIRLAEVARIRRRAILWKKNPVV